MQTTTALIKANNGKMIESKKITIFAELGRDGEVFYKIESQNLESSTAVSFHDNKEKAIAEITNMLPSYLEEQTNKLLKKKELYI